MNPFRFRTVVRLTHRRIRGLWWRVIARRGYKTSCVVERAGCRTRVFLPRAGRIMCRKNSICVKPVAACRQADVTSLRRPKEWRRRRRRWWRGYCWWMEASCCYSVSHNLCDLLIGLQGRKKFLILTSAGSHGSSDRVLPKLVEKN